MDRRDDERVFFRGHASWRAMLGMAARGALLALLAAVAAGLASEIADGRVQVLWVVAAAAAVLAVSLCAVALARVRTTYSITDRRLTIERGLLGRELHQTRLERIQNVTARQSLLERLLGVGTVDFDTAGEAQFGFSFRGVADPRGIVRTVDDALHELRAGGAALADPGAGAGAEVPLPDTPGSPLNG
ncbi:MAG TPA: PH domain-containing protein [Solirubrobacteraceae bacterium]|nr:PH domain-containing protein [Solirubrobacteraceae bacterium]